MKNIYLAVLAITTVAFMSMGCFTTLLHQNSSMTSFEEKYNDTITSTALIQGDKIVCVSEKYHYVFENNPRLLDLIKNRDAQPVVFDIPNGHYEIHDNRISAYLSVYFLNQDGNKSDDSHSERLHLIGTRYVTNKQINDSISVSKCSYDINIKTYERRVDGGEVVEKIILTPVALAVDIILLPIELILFASISPSSFH